MGMGPRMREDTDYEWGGVSPVLLGLIMALLCLGERGRAVREPPLRGRISSGTGFTPILTFPHQGGRDLQARNPAIFILMTCGGKAWAWG